MQSTNLVDVNSLIDEQPSKTVDVNSLIEQPQKKNSLQPSPASSAPSVQPTLPSAPQSKSVESNPPVKPLLNTQQAAEKFGLTPIQDLQNQNVAKSDNTLSVPNAGVFNRQVNAFNEVTDKTITGNAPDESVVIRNEYQKKRKGILNPQVVIPASQLTPENNFGLNTNPNTPQVADNAVNKIQVKPVQGAPVNAVAPPTPEQEFKQKVYDNLSSLEKETIAKSGEYAMKVTSDPVAAGFITKAILGDNMAISQKRQIDKGYTVPQTDLYQTGQVGITSMIAALDKKYESDPQNADYITQRADLEKQATNLIDKFPEYKVSQLTKAVAIELGKLHPEVSNSPSMARLYLPEIKKEMGLSDEDIKAIDFDNYPTSNFLTSTIAPIYKGALGLGLSATRVIGSALGADKDLLNSRLTEAAQSPTFFDDIETMQNTGQTVDVNKASPTFLQNIADPNKGKYNYNFHTISNAIGNGVGQLAWFVYGTKGAGAAANKALGAVAGAAAGDGAISLNGLPVKLSADATNEVGMAGLMMGQGYEDYYQKARTVISDKPEDELKRHAYSLINGALDYFGFRVLGNVVKGLPPAAEKEIGQIFKDAPNLAAVNKKALQSTLTKVLKSVGEATKETAFVEGATTASELAKAVVTNVMGNDEAVKEENKQLPDVILSSLAASPFQMWLPILGSKIIAGGQSKVHKENIYNAGISPENYKGDAHKLFDMGAINQEQLNDRIQVINTADKVVKSIPSDVFDNLNHNQRVTYVNSKIRELALKAKSENVQDEALSAYYADQIKGEVAKRSDVLNGGGKEGEFPESVSVIKPKTQEEINNQIPTVTIAPKENTPETKQGVSVVLPQTVERERAMPTVTVGGKTNENATEKTAQVPKPTEAANTTNETANKVEQPTGESLVSQAKDLVNSGVVKGFTAETLKESANNNPTEFQQHLKDISEQANDPKSNKATVDTYGKELVDIAQKLNPLNGTESDNTTTTTGTNRIIQQDGIKPEEQGDKGKLQEGAEPVERGTPKATTSVLGGDNKIVPKYDDNELIDFAKNSKFKASKDSKYTFFNISDDKQVRITKNNKTGAGKGYHVTVHEKNEDGIGYKTAYNSNDFVDNLQSAKKRVGELYFNEIRKDVSDVPSVEVNTNDYSKISTDELKKMNEKSNGFSEMEAITKELNKRKSEQKKQPKEELKPTTEVNKPISVNEGEQKKSILGSGVDLKGEKKRAGMDIYSPHTISPDDIISDKTSSSRTPSSVQLNKSAKFLAVNGRMDNNGYVYKHSWFIDSEKGKYRFQPSSIGISSVDAIEKSGDNPYEYRSIKNLKDKLVEWYNKGFIGENKSLKDNIGDAVQHGLYDRYINEGRMTASDAKKIIESGELEVPKSILEKANSENKAPKEKPISKPISEVNKKERSDIEVEQMFVERWKKEAKDAKDYLKKYQDNPFADKVQYNKKVLANANKQLKIHQAKLEELRNPKQAKEEVGFDIKLKRDGVIKEGKVSKETDKAVAIDYKDGTTEILKKDSFEKAKLDAEKSSKPTNTKESNFSKKLKDKYKDFNLGGTKSAEKIEPKSEGEIKTDNGKQPIEQYVSRAKEVLNKLFPDATFESYKTKEEYEKAGGAEGTRGMFITESDGSKRLLLNVEQMKEDGIGKTAFHEAIHPIVDEVVGAHPEELNPLWNDLFKEMQGVKGFDKVVEHVDLYKQNERPAAEGLTELLTQIAEGNISLDDVPPARKGIIVDLLNKLFEKLGLNIRFGESYDFKDFATDIKKAFETGDVEALKNVVDERAQANKRAKDNAGKVNDLLFGKSADKGRFEAAASKIADSIRNADIPQWIINTSSEAKQSGFGLSGENMKEALAKSIEAVGKIMDKGVDLKEAIAREVDNFIKNIKSFDGIKDLKPNFEKTLRDNFEKEALNQFSKEQSDRAATVENMVKDAMDEGFDNLNDIKEALTNGLGIDTPEFRKMIDDAYEKVKNTPESEGIVNIPSRTGITHAATAELRDKYGLGNYVRDEAMTDVELQKKADDIIAEGYNPNDLVGQMENGIPPTPVENFILKRYVADLVAKFDKSKSDADFNDLNRVMKAVETIGTLQSSAFRTRGGLVDISETLPGFLREEIELNKNAPLTEGQKKKVEQEYNDIQTANADYEAKIAALEAENAALKEVKNRKANKKPSTRKTHEDYVKERQDAVAGAREALRKLRTGESGLSAVPLPGVRELVAIAPHVKKALVSLVEEGSYKLADYVKELHGQFKDVLEGITEKDINNIIAGKYDEKKATRSELAARMVDLKTEANLVNRLEDLLKGEEPKDEKKKIKRNQAIESLRAKIKQAESFKRGYEKEVEQGQKEPVPDELKRLRAVKLGIERNLRKVQEDIDNGNFSPAQKATSILDNPEVRKQFPEEYKATIEAKDKLIKAKNERHLRLLRQQQENMSAREKAVKGVAEVLNIPRALMTMLDYSAMLRQAVIPTIAHPSLAGKSLVEMIKVGASQKRYDRWFYDLVETPRYKLMELSKLAITDSTSPLLTAREESFMSNLAEKIPVIGKTLNVGNVKIPGTNLVKGSERAYTMYLNKMRVDLFNRFADAMEERGLTFENSPKAYKEMANYVNNSTGRGDLGAKIDRVAPILNSLFFSPRLIASRMNMLTYFAQPRFYKEVPKEVRLSYLKDMTKFIGLGLTVLGLFSINKDDDTKVEIDPRSSDFGKIRNKNTRWDIWGGFQQYVRLFSQMATGERKSTTGKIYTLDGEGAFGQTTTDVLVSFGRGKLAPVPGMAVDLLSRRTIVGEKIKFKTGHEGYKEVNIGRYMQEHLLPLNFTGLQEALQDQGAKAWFTVGIPSTFGVGTQTFDNKTRPKKPKTKYSY